MFPPYFLKKYAWACGSSGLVHNLRGLCGHFTRLGVDGKRDRENIFAVSNLHGYVARVGYAHIRRE